jgi:hypothetical protein
MQLKINDNEKEIFIYSMVEVDNNIGISEGTYYESPDNKRQIQDTINILENALLMARMKYKRMFRYAGDSYE